MMGCESCGCGCVLMGILAGIVAGVVAFLVRLGWRLASGR